MATKDVDGDGDPYLGLYRVLGCSIERLDPQMLLDPFEEEFHLPATSVKLRDGQCWQGEVVGQEYDAFVFLGVEEAYASQFLGIISSAVETFQHNRLIALKSSRPVDWVRVEAPESEIALGPGDKESHGLMHSVESGKVEVASIHDVDGSSFHKEIVENVDVVDLPMGDEDERWDTAPQVQQCVQFHGPFSLAEPGPREERQAKIDNGGIEGVDCLIEIHAEALVGVKGPGCGDKHLSEVGIDTPIAHLVGVGQGVA